jgi:carbonic anhydrase/acetyltransferase-like protein (isoleucine patch superfamily)
MAVYQVGQHVPEVAADAFVADSAQVIGQVRLGSHASVWYGTVIRADNDRITIGRDSNVQDACVLHADDGVPLTIGEGVVIGHQVMLHGCTIGDNTLVGIQSVILNRARIGKNSIVGAGAVIPEGKEFPDGVLLVGAPARVVRELTPEQIEHTRFLAAQYVAQSELHRTTLKRIA